MELYQLALDGTEVPYRQVMLPPLHIGRLHRAILQTLLRGPRCDDDLCSLLFVSPNSLRPRRGELVRHGLLEPRALKPLVSGRNARCWGLTEAGREVLDHRGVGDE